MTCPAGRMRRSFSPFLPYIGGLRTLSVSGNPTQILPILVDRFSHPTLPLKN